MMKLLVTTCRFLWLLLLLIAPNVEGLSIPTSSRQTLASPLFQQQRRSTVAPLHQSSIAVNGGTATVPMSQLGSTLTRIGEMSFILSMCVALPLTLIPQKILYKAGVLTKVRSEKMALSTGQFCARWLMRVIPFCTIETISSNDNGLQQEEPEPSIWVCNHISMLDVFVLLSADLRLRGPKKRPIKIVYWKGLESNPVTKLLFQQCGFIPVEMSDNGHGNDNEYDMSSFRTLLKETKRAFAEGFDIGILPEGQINPTPELGLLPLFSGAFTLGRMSKRPIQCMALYGAGNLWHPIDGMECSNRHVKVRLYTSSQKYSSASEFETTFQKVVGHFGQYGTDVPDYKGWLDGTKWKKKVAAEEKPSATKQ